MSRTTLKLVLLAAAAVALGSSRAQADDWGNLKGRFVFDAKAPDTVKLKIDKDEKICGDKGLIAEDLVIDANGGLANVMVYAVGKMKVHPDYEKTADATIVIDNHGCRFNPHVQGIRLGQTLQVKNSDPVSHNTNVAGQNIQFNQLIAANGGTFDLKVEGPERVPANISCNIHPWMKGKLLVRPNPYFAVSNKDGTFEIKNLPAGEIKLGVLQERSGFVKDAELKGAKATWPATIGEVAKEGSFKVTIEAGKDTDLGDIKLGAAQFNKD